MQQPVAGGYGVGNDATATVTFERMEVESAAGEVHFHYSVDLPAGDAAAGAPGHVELFSTRLDLVLLPRPLTPGEHMTLLCLGANHGAYVFLPFAKVARRYVVRAGHLPPSAVAFMQQLWEGALSEFYYLCDMDVRGAFTIECDAAPDELPPPVLPAAAAADHDERGGADRGGITSEDGRAGAHSTSPGATAGGQEGGREGPGEPGTTGHPAPRPRVLVPFGGGKDSTLLMQLVHDCGCDVAWCYYGEWAGSWAGYSKFQRLLEASPSQRIFIAEQDVACADRLREVSTRLGTNPLPPGQDLNFMDYPPYVSYYVFASAFFALQHGFDYICVGNEHSANFSNAQHQRYGYSVNHQYEKGFAAESAYNAFIKRHISPTLHYFSGLQHMTELEIAKRFSGRCMAYLPLIISCNWATDDRWCGRCEKCAFVYSMFSAFLDSDVVMRDVFGLGGDGPSPAGPKEVPQEAVAGCGDLYTCPELEPAFEQLMGLRGVKPLECVGTPEEVLAAMYGAWLRRGYAGAPSSGSSSHLDSNGPTAPQPPALLARHKELIFSQGAKEWARIEADVARIDAGGKPGVPTLYPRWFVLS